MLRALSAYVGILSAHAQRSTVHDGGSFHGGHSRIPDLYRKLDGCRQATGNPASAPAHLPRAKCSELIVARRFDSVSGLPGTAPWSEPFISNHGGHSAGVRHTYGDSNRRGRHADRDFVT